ncbi:hypothetical protein KU74_12210 [Pectobacterium brasiliense]|uniref:Uncharacterized protein n=1 Tax=Pectobacterium brasiliense TaxID=180957 RepID=A0A0M2F0M1_9GAMM|nr:hypothetical protein [Pectobacterium brasiliense]KGA34233.1 hypothetical protein KU74_12210 [Pectobacterium brasiliense]
MTFKERKEPLLIVFLRKAESSGYQSSVGNTLTLYAKQKGILLIQVEFGLTGQFKNPNYQAHFSDGSVVTFLGRSHRKDSVNARYKDKNLSSGFLCDRQAFMKIANDGSDFH